MVVNKSFVLAFRKTEKETKRRDSTKELLLNGPAQRHHQTGTTGAVLCSAASNERTNAGVNRRGEHHGDGQAAASETVTRIVRDPSRSARTRAERALESCSSTCRVVAWLLLYWSSRRLEW
jgi:hypothetical protein